MGKALHRRVVPETYVQLLYEYLDDNGHDPVKLLGRPWPSVSASGIGGIDVEIWATMLGTTAHALQLPHLPIELAKTISPRHLGVLGAVLLACENLGAALLRFEQYQRLIFDVNPMVLRPHQDAVELYWDVSEYRVKPIVEQAGFAVTLHFARSIARGKIRCQQVRFSGEAPADTKPFEEFFGCPVVFNDPVPGFVFNVDVLMLPLKGSDPSMVEMLQKHADSLLDKLPKQEELIERLRREIAHSLRDGEPDIERICMRMHCSSRTLQRKLLAAGTNFRKEVGVVRLELANDYLKDPRLKIVDVAMLLGYSEHSAFTRAYREWTGQTPQEHRVVE